MRTKRARCLQLSVVEGGRRGELHELRWQVLRGGRQEERAEQQGLINCRGGAYIVNYEGGITGEARGDGYMMWRACLRAAAAAGCFVA